MVCGKGVNDMPRGWRIENEWNNKVYAIWQHMLERCYNENFHKKQPTYKNCSVCNRWLTLSNFIHDFKLIDGYDEIKFLNGELCLDKDIKSNGENKIYCLKQCSLVSKSENTKQMLKTRDNDYLKGENHPMYGRTGENNSCSIKIAQYDNQENFVRVWSSAREIERELNINHSNIITCCKFWEMNCNKEKWFKTYKKNPRKSTGGFIWKYYNIKEEK